MSPTNFPDFPDNETLRMMRELREKMPDSATQRMIDDAKRIHQDPFRQAIIQQHLEFKNQYGDQIKVVAQTLAESETLKRALASVSPIMASQQANRELYLHGINAVQTIYQSIPRETLNSVAQMMAQIQANTALVALQTIRELGYGSLADEFPDFEETIVKEAPTSKPKEVRKAVRKYVAKKKRRGLTPSQWQALNAFMQMFAIIVAIYFGVQQGKPENKTIYVQPKYERVVKVKNYWVARDCELKERPDFKSPTMAVIPKDIEIRVIYTYGKWFYVEFQEQGQELPKHGFVNKKYLKKME
jgi:hypothetical protein